MEYFKITNEELYIILLSKLNDPYLSKYIIQIKIEEEKKEKKEALEYHIERWETISSKYFNSQELSPLSCLRNIYSYVLDSKDLVNRQIFNVGEDKENYRIIDIIHSIKKVTKIINVVVVTPRVFGVRRRAAALLLLFELPQTRSWHY